MLQYKYNITDKKQPLLTTYLVFTKQMSLMAIYVKKQEEESQLVSWLKRYNVQIMARFIK